MEPPGIAPGLSVFQTVLRTSYNKTPFTACISFSKLQSLNHHPIVKDQFIQRTQMAILIYHPRQPLLRSSVVRYFSLSTQSNCQRIPFIHCFTRKSRKCCNCVLIMLYILPSLGIFVNRLPILSLKEHFSSIEISLDVSFLSKEIFECI